MFIRLWLDDAEETPVWINMDQIQIMYWKEGKMFIRFSSDKEVELKLGRNDYNHLIHLIQSKN